MHITVIKRACKSLPDCCITFLKAVSAPTGAAFCFPEGHSYRRDGFKVPSLLILVASSLYAVLVFTVYGNFFVLYFILYRMYAAHQVQYFCNR